MKRFLIILFFASSVQAKASEIVGYIENVRVEDSALTLPAKLDTGADVSSIDAKIISQGNGMVEFAIGNNVFTKRIIRWVKIKARPHGFQNRPVVLMCFYMAGHVMESEVNLNDRSNFDYPVLIGRNMLKAANLVVDPAKSFTLIPQ